MKLDVRAQRIYRGFFIAKKLFIMTKFIEVTCQNQNGKDEKRCINIDRIVSFRPANIFGCRINVAGDDESHYTKETYEEIKYVLSRCDI
jgi:hypothetical protein